MAREEPILRITKGFQGIGRHRWHISSGKEEIEAVFQVEGIRCTKTEKRKQAWWVRVIEKGKMRELWKSRLVRGRTRLWCFLRTDRKPS